jgi:cytochrome c biogenesis factor
MFAQAPTPTSALTEAEKVRRISQNEDFVIYSLILVGVLLVAAVVFYFLERWRRSNPKGEVDREAGVSLTSFREMYENGEITESEYQRLKEQTASKIKGAKDTPAPATPPAQPTPPAGTPPAPG